jgi:mevalonate kinase
MSGPQKNGHVRSHGKVILAGEHSVVRGGEALVLPLRSRGFDLHWEESPDGKFHVKAGPFAEPFRDSLHKALELTGFQLPRRGYSVRMESDIPVQAGLGSSAALAVAVVRFLIAEGAKIGQPFALALEIENIFHGNSSGIDVACVLSSTPIRYARHAPPQDLRLAWRPYLYLFDTGRRASTKECVRKVQAAARPDLDQRMQESVTAVKSALLSEQADRREELAKAMELAGSCFTEWGLGPTEEERRKLLEAGALAVKPTGSGGGGFLLTLWANKPSESLGLIPVWEAAT